MCHCVLLHHLRSALFLFLLLLCHRIVIVFGLSIFAFIFLLFIFLSCISQSCCICIKKNSHTTKSWTFVIRSLSTRFAVSVVVFFFFTFMLYLQDIAVIIYTAAEKAASPETYGSSCKTTSTSEAIWRSPKTFPSSVQIYTRYGHYIHDRL